MIDINIPERCYHYLSSSFTTATMFLIDITIGLIYRYIMNFFGFFLHVYLYGKMYYTYTNIPYEVIILISLSLIILDIVLYRYDSNLGITICNTVRLFDTMEDLQGYHKLSLLLCLGALISFITLSTYGCWGMAEMIFNERLDFSSDISTVLNQPNKSLLVLSMMIVSAYNSVINIIVNLIIFRK